MGNAIRHEGPQIVKVVLESDDVTPGDRITIEDSTGYALENGDTDDTIDMDMYHATQETPGLYTPRLPF